jgi:hypothetical protein
MPPAQEVAARKGFLHFVLTNTELMPSTGTAPTATFIVRCLMFRAGQ